MSRDHTTREPAQQGGSRSGLGAGGYVRSEVWGGSKWLYDVSAPNMNLRARDDRCAATTVDSDHWADRESAGLVRSVDLVTGGATSWVDRTSKNKCSLTSQIQPDSTIWACGGAHPRDDGSWERLPLRGKREERDGRAPGRAARGSLEGSSRGFVA